MEYLQRLRVKNQTIYGNNKLAYDIPDIHEEARKSIIKFNKVLDENV